EHVSAKLPSANPMQSKLLNFYQNVTNKFEGHNLLKRKNEEVDLENAEDNNVDDAENVEDDNVDNVKNYQPKTEEFVQDNRNSKTNVECNKSSSKDKKLST
ncbi:25947_t:CDS:1, partial [Gigaspora margarita]